MTYFFKDSQIYYNKYNFSGYSSKRSDLSLCLLSDLTISPFPPLFSSLELQSHTLLALFTNILSLHLRSPLSLTPLILPFIKFSFHPTHRIYHKKLFDCSWCAKQCGERAEEQRDYMDRQVGRGLPQPKKFGIACPCALLCTLTLLMHIFPCALPEAESNHSNV